MQLPLQRQVNRSEDELKHTEDKEQRQHLAKGEIEEIAELHRTTRIVMLCKPIQEHSREPASKEHFCHILQEVQQTLCAVLLLQVFGWRNLVELGFDLLRREGNRLLDNQRGEYKGRHDRKQGYHLDQCARQPSFRCSATVVENVRRIAVSVIHQCGKFAEHGPRHNGTEHDGSDDNASEQGKRIGFLGLGDIPFATRLTSLLFGGLELLLATT